MTGGYWNNNLQADFALDPLGLASRRGSRRYTRPGMADLREEEMLELSDSDASMVNTEDSDSDYISDREIGHRAPRPK